MGRRRIVDDFPELDRDIEFPDPIKRPPNHGLNAKKKAAKPYKPRSVPTKGPRLDFDRDPSIVPRLQAGIEKGLHPVQAASLAGISWRTYERWRHRARLGDERYTAVEEAIREAQAKFAQKCVEQIMVAGLKGVGDRPADWKALERVLKVVCPDVWRDKVEISNQNEQEFEARRLLDVVRQVVGNEAAETIIRLYLAESVQGIPGDTATTESGGGAEEASD